MTDYYKRWSDADAVQIFAEKKVGDFFQSEQHLLQSILPDVRSVLDVGCASGRYVDLLLSLRPELAGTLDFHGIDISAENVRSARVLYPQHDFQMGNALEHEPGRRFDLINATGVCQHEPRFEDLIRRMVGWSDKYVLFDVKFAAVDEHIADIGRAFAGSASNRLYFVLLNYSRFVTFLQNIPNVAAVRVFGYETPVNARVTVPPNVAPIVSAGILLSKGSVTGAAVLESNVVAPK
jgi:SAM-dependent methyltransferase